MSTIKTLVLITLLATTAHAQVPAGPSMLGVASGIGMPVPNGPGVPPPPPIGMPVPLPPAVPGMPLPPQAPQAPQAIPQLDRLTAALMAVEVQGHGDSEYYSRRRDGYKRALMVKLALQIPWTAVEMANATRLFTPDELRRCRADLPERTANFRTKPAR